MEVYQYAQGQKVVGLVTAGIEHVVDTKIPQTVKLVFVGSASQIEQRNVSINQYIGKTVKKMVEADISPVLVKGQGVAQCFERPSWRQPGDIDFFFAKSEYDKAVRFFMSLKNAREVQNAHYTKSFGVVLESWFIELHGTLRNGLSTRMDKEIDAVQGDLFYGGNVRSWDNNGTTVFLPSPNNDVFLVFVHFVRHFYKEGVCLRQICDLCRLIWTYKHDFDVKLLESRLDRASLLDEWKAFAALAVDYLDMPSVALPLYDDKRKWHKKGKRIMNYVLDEKKKTKIVDVLTVARIFPLSTIKYSPSIFFNLNWLKIKERLFGA